MKDDIEVNCFLGFNQFMGIEWWNKLEIGNFSFSVRYEIEFSNLMHAQELINTKRVTVR
jgi:hypothetical protein